VAGRTYIVIARDAEQTIVELAEPALDPVAELVAGAIPEQVPVNQGVARASYKISVSGGTSDREGTPTRRVYVGSPFWHWLEYGTRYSTPYRPVQRAVESVGLEYVPR
jgi:hypothetical protein